MTDPIVVKVINAGEPTTKVNIVPKADPSSQLAIIPSMGKQGPKGPAGDPNLGSFSNNDQTINGIESETVVDSFVASEWRMVRYFVSIAKTGDNKFYSTEISVLIDSSNINVTEYGMMDNNGDMGTIEIKKVSGNLQLVVTPNPSVRPVTVRFARIGLKA